MAQTTCMSCVAAAAAQAATAQDMGKQTRLVSYIQAVKWSWSVQLTNSDP